MMRDKIGIVVGQGQHAQWFLDNGFKHFRINATWACRVAEGEEYLKRLLNAIKEKGGSVLADTYAIPASLDPSQPTINRWTFPAIAIFKDEFIQPMQDDLFVLLKLYGEYIDIVSLATEVNIANVWKDPVTGQARGMKDYVDKVVIPCKEICRIFDKPVLAGSPTLRGESTKTFLEATREFITLQHRGHGNVDHLDFHAYRDTSDAVINDIKKFLGIVKPNKRVFISEGFGFNGTECFTAGEKFSNFFRYGFKTDRGYSPEQKQLRNYKEWLQFLWREGRIRRAYHYAAGGVGGDSLLLDNGAPSLSAIHLKEALEWHLNQVR